MNSIAEKRVYGDSSGRRLLAVAAASGLVIVALAEDRVGEFGLVHGGDVADVAVGAETIAVATADDLYVGSVSAAAAPGDVVSLSPTAIGPSVATAVTSTGVYGVGPEGTLRARTTGDWATVGTVSQPTVLDGSFLGTGAGVYSVDDLSSPIALSDSRIAAVTAAWPHVGTADGCYRIADGSVTRVRTGALVALDSLGHPTGGRRIIAASSSELATYSEADPAWQTEPSPTDAGVSDVALFYSSPGDVARVVLSDRAELSVDVGDGWRTRSLGLSEARAVVPLDVGSS